ncbi:hypothetical protein K227x_01350 [Rubripirellula lacrimiformis]|uniref:Uncharacterized protein n=1 Tax=Rubripirellula lacrimiformis TaxID=1930273 RepID=A0A517N3Q1_9BACT|nr:hypothetical protein K227x_01350 [Rubripirellula lacrimiformis]
MSTICVRYAFSLATIVALGLLATELVVAYPSLGIAYLIILLTSSFLPSALIQLHFNTGWRFATALNYALTIVVAFGFGVAHFYAIRRSMLPAMILDNHGLRYPIQFAAFFMRAILVPAIFSTLIFGLISYLHFARFRRTESPDGGEPSRAPENAC